MIVEFFGENPKPERVCLCTLTTAQKSIKKLEIILNSMRHFVLYSFAFSAVYFKNNALTAKDAKSFRTEIRDNLKLNVWVYFTLLLVFWPRLLLH
jgi:hypothetical protein